MSFQSKKGQILWKLHFSSPIEKVYDALTTDNGRRTYWAEETEEKDECVEFTFLNHPKVKSKILGKEAPDFFRIEYFNTEVTFKLESTDDGGTDLTLINLVTSEKLKQEMVAGWVSVLLSMKGAVDFGVDLRNHNSKRTWSNGYLDN